MIIQGLKNVIQQKSENHPNRPPVAISVSRANQLLRLRTLLVGMGHKWNNTVILKQTGSWVTVLKSKTASILQYFQKQQQGKSKHIAISLSLSLSLPPLSLSLSKLHARAHTHTHNHTHRDRISMYNFAVSLSAKNTIHCYYHLLEVEVEFPAVGKLLQLIEFNQVQ